MKLILLSSSVACLTIAFGLYVIPLIVVVYIIAGAMARSEEEE